MFTLISLVCFFITQITNKQRHCDKSSNWEQLPNTPCSETVNHLTETRHRIFTFYSYQMKLSFYLKLCLCLGSWSEKIPALKSRMKFTAATCEFKHLKSSIKVYLSTQKRPQPSLGSIKFICLQMHLCGFCSSDMHWKGWQHSRDPSSHSLLL